VNTSVQRTDAQANANSETLNTVSGQLVTIRSAQEQAIIADMAAQLGSSIWLGATDATVEGEWRWLDGSTENDLFWQGDGDGYNTDDSFGNFLGGTPDSGSGNEDDLLFRDSDGFWDDASASTFANYIVEWDADEVLDATDALIYSITSQTVAGALEIDADSGEIRVLDGSLLDYETNAIQTLTVRTTDVDSNAYDETFTISLNDLAEFNDAPTDLSSGIELNIDGGNDAYLIADDGGAILGGLSEVTLEASFAIDGVSVTPLLSYASTTGDDLLAYLNGSGELVFVINGSSFVILSGINYDDLMDGERHHLAISWDNTNGDWHVLVDGEVTDSGTGLAVGQTIAGGSGTGSLVFGQEQDSVGGGFGAHKVFNGTYYDIRIWDEVRSAAEIALNHQHKLVLTPAQAASIGLVANWRMEEFDGSNEIVDSVGGNNLSIGHAVGAGFVNSTPLDNPHISENAINGNIVGFVLPSDPDITNDVVRDGLFTEGLDPVNSSTYTTGQSFGDWTVTGTADVFVHNADGRYQDETPLGGNAVHLAAIADNAITQTLATEAGRQYQVIFAGSGHWDTSGVKQLRVSAGGTSADFVYGEAPDNWNFANSIVWEHGSFTFTATDSSTQLSFADISSYVGQGTLIADIQVIEIPQAISTILNNDATLDYDAATGKFYRAVNSVVDFASAQSDAIANALNGISGQLLTINSQYENELIRNMDGLGALVWLRASDTGVEGEFRWLDGDEEGELFWTGGVAGSAAAGQYANFSAGQPDNFTGVQDHVVFNYTKGKWDDVGSTSATPTYVIEWDANKVLSNYVFSMTDDAGGRFSIHQSTGEITVADGSLLDYETATSHDVDVTTTDATGQVFMDTITIFIDNGIDPIQDVPGSQTINEDTVLTFSSGNGNAITASDTLINSDASLQVSISVNNGVLDLSQTSGLSIVAPRSKG